MAREPPSRDEIPERTAGVLLVIIRILQAPDGPAALAILNDCFPPDLLLSDVMLPRSLSGPDLAEEVKCELPAIKFLFMSG